MTEFYLPASCLLYVRYSLAGHCSANLPSSPDEFMWAPTHNAPFIRFLISALYILFVCLYRMLLHLFFFLHFFLTYLLPYLSLAVSEWINIVPPSQPGAPPSPSDYRLVTIHNIHANPIVAVKGKVFPYSLPSVGEIGLSAVCQYSITALTHLSVIRHFAAFPS